MGASDQPLTHLDRKGHAHMVDVGSKADTERVAIARARVSMNSETLRLIVEGGMPKGDVFGVARVAGIMAAKKTSELIPLCHPVPVTAVEIELSPGDDGCSVEIETKVKSRGKTGVEMEALTAACCTALTIYDMCKAVDREMVIEDVRLVYKAGGKSGEFLRRGESVNVRGVEDQR